jgi:hypothetical protein
VELETGLDGTLNSDQTSMGSGVRESGENPGGNRRFSLESEPVQALNAATGHGRGFPTAESMTAETNCHGHWVCKL